MRRADNITNFVCPLSGNMGASTSWNPQGYNRYSLLKFYESLKLYI